MPETKPRVSAPWSKLKISVLTHTSLFHRTNPRPKPTSLRETLNWTLRFNSHITEMKHISKMKHFSLNKAMNTWLLQGSIEKMHHCITPSSTSLNILVEGHAAIATVSQQNWLKKIYIGFYLTNTKPTKNPLHHCGWQWLILPRYYKQNICSKHLFAFLLPGGIWDGWMPQNLMETFNAERSQEQIIFLGWTGLLFH